MSKRKILVVEDDANTLLFIQYNLEEMAGYDVLTAENGVEGLRLAREEKPDLVVSDIMMPKMNGFELCKQMKGDASTADIPLIFLSAKGMVSDRVRGLRMGASDFIAKPFNPEELVTRIEVILQKKEEEKKTTNSVNEGISGSLAEMDMTDLLQMLKMGRKTGILTVNSQEEITGRIFFQNGAPIQAFTGVLDDEQAIYRMIGWKRGQFVFEPTHFDLPQRINRRLENILLEGSRLLDEHKKIEKKLPKPELYFIPNPLFQAQEWHPTPEQKQLLALSTIGLNWSKIKELSTLGDYETAKTMSELLDSEILEDDAFADQSVTRTSSVSLTNLLKLSIQLERHNIVTDYEKLEIAELYEKLNPHNNNKPAFSVLLMATEEELIAEILSTLNPKINKNKEQPVHFGTIKTTDFLLYIIALPVIKRYQGLQNFLVKFSTGKLILLSEPQKRCSLQLAQIEKIVFEQYNKEHSIVLIKTEEEESDCAEFIHLQILKSENVDVDVFEFEEADKSLLIDVLKKILYSFLPQES